MIDKDVLINIGLTKNETDVYLCLLRLKEALAGDIAKKTGISRTYIYDTIEKLNQKGLASYVVKNNKRYYRAGSPSKIIDYLKEQASRVNNIIPELLLMHKPLSNKPIVEIYDGPEGMKSILSTFLNSKTKDWLVLGSSGNAESVIGEYLDIFEARRIKQKIKMYSLMNLSEGGIRRGNILEKYPLTQVRYLPKEYTSLVSVYVFGEYISLMLWMKEKPLGVLIKDRDISESFRKHFWVLWELSKKTSKTD
jgi:sugar-specific transcriptional regulator TrmB